MYGQTDITIFIDLKMIPFPLKNASSITILDILFSRALVYIINSDIVKHMLY